MRLLGNILWFILGGWLVFLLYALGALIFFPMFVPLFRLAKYAAWPFGRSVVTQAELEKYRAIKGIENESSKMQKALRLSSGGLNLLWMFTFGWMLAFVHFISAIINIVLFFLIVTIPNIGGNWKLMRIALMPFNKVIVPDEVAKEINIGISKAKLNI